MLSRDQREQFERTGVLVLPEAVGSEVAAEMCARIWDYLSKRGVSADAPGEQSVTPSKVRGAIQEQSFDGLWGESVRAAIDSILGRDGWRVPGHAGQLLSILFPQRGPNGKLDGDGRWVLPSKVWHLDYQAPGWLRGLPGLQVFVCLDKVEPRAGATLAIEGSHRLIDRIRRVEGPEFSGRSADVRRELRKHVTWFRELCSVRPGEDRIARFMDQATEHEGVELRVVEFSGAPGDVVLMHPWIVHAPAPNCGKRPRMVLTERIRTQPRPANSPTECPATDTE